MRIVTFPKSYFNKTGILYCCFLTIFFISSERILAQDTFNCTSDLFQVVDGRDLRKLDPATGNYEFVGIAQQSYNGAGFNVEDGYIYGMSGNSMVRINNLGQSTNLGPVTGFSALSYSGDFDTEGNWYSFKDQKGTFIMNTVDVSNPLGLVAVQDVIIELSGDGTLGNCADIAYNSLTNKFYGMSKGVIHEFDHINKTVTPIANYSSEIVGGNGFGAVWTDVEGSVYFFNNASGNVYKANFNNAGEVTNFAFAATTEPNGSNDGIGCSLAQPPTFPEICDNGIDDDGDGLIDCEDDDCTASNACKIDGSITSTTTSTENGFVTYQVFLNNNTNINKSFNAIDTLPTGFTFVQDTLAFDQNGYSDFTLNPIENDTGQLTWGTINLEPGESVRLAYDLLINSSVQPASYQNAFTLSNNELKEGTLQATVEIIDAYEELPFPCEPAFYQVYQKRGKNQPNMYGRLNANTGDYDPIAIASDYANGLGYDINTGLVYGASGKKFIMLDANGTVIYRNIDFNKKVYRGDIDENSLWYGVDGNDMVVIDVSGTPVEVARYNGQGLIGWDIAYNKDGNFYSVHNNTLYKFDTSSNTKSTIGTLIGNGLPSSGYGAQWTGSDGYLYLSNNASGKIIRVDITSRESRVVSQSIDGLSKNDGFSCPTSIPAVFGYDFGDNINIPPGGLLSYHQDINDDEIPEYAMVWLGSTVSVDDTDLSNSDATGDTDDGVFIAKSVVDGQAVITLNMNSNFSTTAHYLIGIDWDSDGIIDDTVADSTPINGATSVVKLVDVPVDYVTTLINFRIMISEEPLVAADISGYVEKLGEIEDYRKALATPEICNNGIDDDLDGLYDCDDDDCAGFTDCTTTATSGGNNGGLESNNRLADKIAKRYYNRYKTNTNDIKVNVAARNLHKLPKDHDIYRKSKNNNFALIDLMPKQAIENTVPFNSTPNDLIGVTNAVETLSVDYFDGETRKGAILSTVSEDGVYEHTKAVCDRVTGTSVVNIWKTPMFEDHELLISKLRYNEDQVEYSCTFSFYFDSQDQIQIENHWNISEYPYNDTYYNFQVWADNTLNLKTLVGDLLQNIKALSDQEINYDVGEAPTVFVRSFDYRNHKLYINVVNPNGVEKIDVRGILSESETTSDRTFYDEFILSGAIEDQIIYDTQGVYTMGFTINNSENAVADNIFFADGVWGTDVDESKETISTFATYRDFQSENPDDLYIERGAKVRGTINEKFVLYRSIEAKFGIKDISAYNGFAFSAKANKIRDMDIILVNPNISFEQQLKAKVTLKDSEDIYVLDFNAFEGNQSNLENISMIIFEPLNWENDPSHFALELTKLRFSNDLAASSKSIASKKTLNLVHPNPVTSISTITFESHKSTSYKLNIYNIMGALVYSSDGEITIGINQVEFNRGNQPDGNYTYEIILDKEEHLSGKLIFQ